MEEELTLASGGVMAVQVVALGLVGSTLAMLGLHAFGAFTGLRGFKRRANTEGFNAPKAHRTLTAALAGESAYYAVGFAAAFFIAPNLTALFWIMAVMLFVHVAAALGNLRLRAVRRLGSGEGRNPRLTLRRLYGATGVFDSAEFIILLYVLTLLYPLL